MYPKQNHCILTHIQYLHTQLQPSACSQLQENVQVPRRSSQTVRGWPVMTISRGELVWNDGEILSTAGRGRFIARERPFPPRQDLSKVLSS